MPGDTLDQMRDYIGRMARGDASARGELIGRACERLRRLAAAMLPGRDRLRRWIDTDDLLQSAVARLMRSLDSVAPESPEHFLRLAATHMRRELVDLARRHYGPQGAGAHERPAGGDSSAAPPDPAGSSSTDPQRLAHWTDLHERIAAMPDGERGVFELVWYHGLTQAEAAAVLGMNEAKLRRLWIAARLRLRASFGDEMPPL